MQIIFLAAAESVGFVLGVAAISRSRWQAPGVCWLSALSLIPLICWSPVLSVQAILTLIFAAVCVRLRSGPKTIVASATLAAAISFGLAFSMPLAELRDRQKLRDEFPLVSLSDRLAYETKRTRSDSRADDGPASPITISRSDVERRLTELENRDIGNSRRYALESVHDRVRDQFVMARGFGNVRMRRVTIDQVELPGVPPIPLPDKPYVPESDPGTVPAVASSFQRSGPSPVTLLKLHTMGLEDFLDPERIGYVRDRDHVAGFLSHGFTKMPDFGWSRGAQTDWNIVWLELISLLKHDTPVAYQSKNLPQMNELADAPNRPLDGFEHEALERLRRQEDLVIDEGDSEIRMVGSIRAGKDCLQFHSVHRGELLGAFTYELTPARSMPAKKLPPRRPEPQA